MVHRNSCPTPYDAEVMNSRKINPDCLVWISGLIIILSAAWHVPYTLLVYPSGSLLPIFNPRASSLPPSPIWPCCLEKNQHIVGAGKAHEFPHKLTAAQPQLWRGHSYKWAVLARPFRTNWYPATSPELGLSSGTGKHTPGIQHRAAPLIRQADHGWQLQEVVGLQFTSNLCFQQRRLKVVSWFQSYLGQQHAGKNVTLIFRKHAHRHDWWLISTGICQSSWRKVALEGQEGDYCSLPSPWCTNGTADRHHAEASEYPVSSHLPQGLGPAQGMPYNLSPKRELAVILK